MNPERRAYIENRVKGGGFKLGGYVASLIDSDMVQNGAKKPSRQWDDTESSSREAK